MRWTKQQYEEYCQQHVQADNTGAGIGPFFQELQADSDQQKDGQAVHHVGPKEKEVDGRGVPQFRVSIKYLVSDYRRRDAWGMAETIADCLCLAARRLLGTDAPRRTKRGAGSKGARGLRGDSGKD